MSTPMEFKQHVVDKFYFFNELIFTLEEAVGIVLYFLMTSFFSVVLSNSAT